MSPPPIKGTVTLFSGKRSRYLRDGGTTRFFNAYIGVDLDLGQTMPNRDHFVYPTLASLERRFGVASRDPEAWLDDLREVIPAYVHCSAGKDRGATHFAPAGHAAAEIMIPIDAPQSWGIAHQHDRSTDYRRQPRYLELKQ